jgi:hypothetical protein
MMIASKVNSCAATDCAYNKDETCRALAITVENPSAATCATYTPRAEKGGVEMNVANVGACKASSCKHNKDLVCTATSIKVGMKGDSVTCLTFDEG